MSVEKRTVLITGCSDNSLGAALAMAFHEAGLLVYATARNPAKLTQVAAAGCQTLILDVTSESSIATCVAQLPRLDILINNAGAGYNMPVSDISIQKAKQLFDLNVWSCIAMTQAFLPLLLASKGLLVNHTSVGSSISIPFQAAYNASKAAMSIFNDALRMELSPFDVRVTEIKTGGAISNFMENNFTSSVEATLPHNSIYQPARDIAESILRGQWIAGRESPADEWAKQVVSDLLQKHPPLVIWRGSGATNVRLATFLPVGYTDKTLKKMTMFSELEKEIKIKMLQT